MGIMSHRHHGCNVNRITVTGLPMNAVTFDEMRSQTMPSIQADRMEETEEWWNLPNYRRL